AFFRDVLGFPSVDVGDGWLIFAAPPSEVACHPGETNSKHELYLMCDDVQAEIARLCAASWAGSYICARQQARAAERVCVSPPSGWWWSRLLRRRHRRPLPPRDLLCGSKSSRGTILPSYRSSRRTSLSW